MKLRRIAALTIPCLVLGFVTSTGLALFLAWARPPINSFGGYVTDVVPLSNPVQSGKNADIEVLWVFQDQRRFGERTLSWMGSRAREHWTASITPRPPTFAPVDAFFDHTYIPSDHAHWIDMRWRERGGFNVARVYGWPFCCLWEGESLDGPNAGLTRLPWNERSYGGLKIGMSGPIPHFLPTLPLWTGLIGDTFIYSAAWMGLFVLLPGFDARA